MAERTFLQRIADEAVDFFEFVDGALRRAGGTQSDHQGSRRQPERRQPATSVFPPAPMESIKAYRDDADPGAEAEAAVLADVLLLLDAIASNIELLGMGDVGASAEQLGQSLRRPDGEQLRAVALPPPVPHPLRRGGDRGRRPPPTAPASNAPVRVGSSFAALFSFLFNPGKTLAQLEPGADPNVPLARLQRAVDRRRAAPRRGGARLDARQREVEGHHRRPARRVGCPRPGLRLDDPAAQGRRHRQLDAVVLVLARSRRRLRARRRGRRAVAAHARIRTDRATAGRSCSSPSAATSSTSSRSARAGSSR